MINSKYLVELIDSEITIFQIQNPPWKVLGEENLHPKLPAKSKI